MCPLPLVPLPARPSLPRARALPVGCRTGRVHTLVTATGVEAHLARPTLDAVFFTLVDVWREGCSGRLEHGRGEGERRRQGGPAFCGQIPEDRPLPHTSHLPRAWLAKTFSYHAGEPGGVVALASPLCLCQWLSHPYTLCMAESEGEQGGSPSTGLRSSWTKPRPCASWKVCSTRANFRGHYNSHQQLYHPLPVSLQPSEG